ncbi:hypothetical protein DPMN_119017 [Dreissena polymorpha]|uniref:Uncharacterized protein n=1 Tax=Dreissena polymorpha TaxID=45954 RepID=A0A9D4GL76_DREPO|nr:hypothetical protein DPMN_119017 [Dreissena polymorpha]
MACRVLTRFYDSHIKNTSPLGSHFHDNRAINVASRVITRFYYRKMPCPLAAIHILTIFHKDWTINLASRVLTRKYEPPPGSHFHEDWTINVASREKAPPLGSHVFQAKVTSFELIQDIIGTNFPSTFYEDPKINVASRVLTRKNAPPPDGHVFQPTGIIFKLVHDIFGVNLLTKFHKDWKINVASTVHGFQANVTIFKLIQDIIETNILTKFHEDWTINVASKELTRQMLTSHNTQRTTHDVRRPTDKRRSQKLTISDCAQNQYKCIADRQRCHTVHTAE